MIDLDKFKGKTLDEAAMAELRQLFDSESTRADAAEEKARKAAKESIDGRKTLKAERDAAFEKLGVTSMDELQALPEAKGQADALKQLEAKIAKATKDLAEVTGERDQALKAVTGMRRDAAIAAGIEGVPFHNPGDMRALIGQRVEQDGEDWKYRTDDGKLVPIKDGVAQFAKARPQYVKAQGAGGSGSGFNGGGGGGEVKKGSLGGSREERIAAISARFPQLAASN